MTQFIFQVGISVFKEDCNPFSVLPHSPPLAPYFCTGELENFRCWEKEGLAIFEFLGEGEGKKGGVDFFQGVGVAEYFLKVIFNFQLLIKYHIRLKKYKLQLQS